MDSMNRQAEELARVANEADRAAREGTRQAWILHVAPLLLILAVIWILISDGRVFDLGGGSANDNERGSGDNQQVQATDHGRMD